MTPETELEERERKLEEVLCGLLGHEFENIEMPEDWKDLTTALTCRFCSYAPTIMVNRVKDKKAQDEG